MTINVQSKNLIVIYEWQLEERLLKTFVNLLINFRGNFKIISNFSWLQRYITNDLEEKIVRIIC